MKQHIYNVFKPLLLALSLSWTVTVDALADGWPTVTGNNYSEITITNRADEPTDLGGHHEIIYANEGDTKTFQLQEYAGDNLDGYIRWYVVENTADIKDPSKQFVGNVTLGGNNDQVHLFKNGYAWLRQKKDGKDRNSPTAINTIKYTVDFKNSTAPIYLVCEASANNDLIKKSDDSWEAPMVSYRQVYEIRKATRRVGKSLETGWGSQLPTIDETLKAKFMQSYEIHIPISRLQADGKTKVANMTSFRLPERLSNYYVPTGEGENSSLVEANQVRWTIYDSKGRKVIGPTTTDKNILPNQTFYGGGGENDFTHRQTYYITTEVRKNGETESTTTAWYPVSFLTVILEPYAEAMTQEELTDHIRTDRQFYQQRSLDYLLNHNYVQLENITFDTEKDVLDQNKIGTSIETYLQQNPDKNYSTSPMSNVDSYYAFANPGDYANRKNQRMSVGRGEYALYRTLNFADISKGDISQLGVYNDYFAGIYNKKVVDRRWEQTGGKESGYFMYLDATDEPGVITRMNLEGLCPHTSLVVSAWICDLAHSTTVAQADIDFTFKRIKDNGEEVILSRFYSGAIDNKPLHTDTEHDTARWQEVFFQFTFPDGGDDDRYILEVANNAPSSAGADYAIDDIKVFRSLPRAEVNRPHDCTIDSLEATTDLATLYNNMGWTAGEPIPAIQTEDILADFGTRRYRYGLMGVQEADKNQTKLGNYYFAFLENFDENNPDQQDNTDGKHKEGYKWVVINKEAEGSVPEAVHAVRVVASTDTSLMMKTPEAALQAEQYMNLVAIQDYNKDVALIQEALKSGSDDPVSVKDSTGKIFKITRSMADTLQPVQTELLPSAVENGLTPAQLAEYDSVIKKLYGYLNIPRIRIPYLTDDEILHLNAIETSNTDLHSAGELLPDGTKATGQYHVMIFSAIEVAGNQSDTIYPHRRCALVSPFKVQGVMSINIHTATEYEAALCIGSQRKLSATLLARDDQDSTITIEKPYVFDWYLDTDSAYTALANAKGFTVKQALKAVRDGLEGDKRFGVLDTTTIRNSSVSDAYKDLLIDLIKTGYLRTGIKPGTDFTLNVRSANIMALPYIEKPGSTDNLRYCADEAIVEFDSLKTDTPLIYPGYEAGENNTDSVYLRLGLRHLAEDVTMKIPVRSNAVLSDSASYLALPSVNGVLPEITWVNPATGNTEKVGEALSMRVEEGDTTSYLTIKWTKNASTSFQEGGAYKVYIPFIQMQEKDEPLTSECDGLATLYLKVVPEYLTWKGVETDRWEDDTKWNQSTEAELYKGNKVETDANGSDDVTKAFAPLYFTKVTVPDGRTLTLEEKIDTDADEAAFRHDIFASELEGKETTLSPAYVNRINEIYFKPDARLRHQQYLAYDTARVEFEMAKNQKYWLASPLQEVFAGDMYAPKGTARQETDAFAPIFYSAANDRQNPAFYQKAWDKGVTIYTDENGTAASAKPYSVVKSNWSVEYNDVNVPYALGKGFYASVEDFENADNKALVRLPKADKSYRYEELKQTKAAFSSIAERKDSVGRLASSEPIKVLLSNSSEAGVWGKDGVAIADGDGKHFLLGNPYMYPLDINSFLNENTVLAKKFWTVTTNVGEDSESVIVGTPDVENWGEGETKITEIGPMQAFFVELATPETETADASSSKEVTFKPSMMANEPETTTRSVSASAPILRLTAEKDGKRSIAYLTERDDAVNDYESDKDAVTLLDSELTDIPQVYTVAGDRAAGVNAVKHIQNIPLGVYAAGKEGAVTLTFDGISHFASTLYLYDAVTKSERPLTGDSYTLHLDGESHGRYFLRAGEQATANEEMAAAGISIYSAVAGEVIVSATEPLTMVQAVTPAGRMCVDVSPRQPLHRFTLPQGVYIIRAAAGDVVRTVKIRVR